MHHLGHITYSIDKMSQDSAEKYYAANNVCVYISWASGNTGANTRSVNNEMEKKNYSM